MSRRAALRLAALLALLALPAAGPSARAADAPGGVTLEMLADTVSANEAGQWPIDFVLHNQGQFGFELDSLALVTTPRAGPQAGRSSRNPMRFALGRDAVGSGEDKPLHYQFPAGPVDTRLALEIAGHTRDVPAIRLTAAVLARAYDITALHPSTLVRADGRTRELVRLPAANMPANGIGVLWLPDEGAEPAAEIPLALRLSDLGFTVVIAYPPGTGRSDGPADFAGPASQAAAKAALDTLAAQPGVDPARLAAWGTGTGGTLALLLAETRAGLRAVVAQSAHVDPWASFRALAPGARARFVAEAGRDSAAWRARSPLASEAKLAVPVLLLHGEKDAVAPADPVHALAVALRARSVPMDELFDRTAGHALPQAIAMRKGQLFLKSSTAGAR